MIHIIFFLLLGIIIVNGDILIKNKTKLVETEFASCVSIKNKIMINFFSENNMPFSLTVYTPDGIPLNFKGKDITYTGKITYFEIKNLGKHPNNLVIKFYNEQIDMFDVILIIISICSIFILIFFKRDHHIAQICLSILLFVKVYDSRDYTKVADRIIHKILF